MLLIAGCETTDYSLDKTTETTVNYSNPYGPTVTAKRFVVGEYLTSSVQDEQGQTWTLTYDKGASGWDDVSNTTSFVYHLAAPEKDGGSHLSYRALVECATFQTASPEPIVNDNPNGDIEWGPGVSTITLTYEGMVGEGVVNWGLKAPGSGGNQSVGLIAGPCQGVYDITGTVFLNNTQDGSNSNLTKEPSEPGVANVEVQLLESYSTGGEDFQVDQAVLTSPDDWDFGQYKFTVVGPPLEGPPDDPVPVRYRVYVPETSETGINAALFSDLFDRLDTYTKDVDFSDTDSIDFAFELNVKNAIAKFDDPLGLKADGLPREYWKVQATQKGSPKYVPDMLPPAFENLLNCVAGGPTCIQSVPDGADDFGRDELIGLVVMSIDGFNDVEEAIEILKTASKSSAREGLRTEILVGLLNFTSGRGVCKGALDEATGRCASVDGEPGFDSDLMRAFIEDALVVLKNSNYDQSASKAGDGSLSNSQELLSRTY